MIGQFIFTREEQRIAHMLEEKATYLTPYYEEAVREARASTLQRLILSLMREDIAGIYSKSYDAPQPMPGLDKGLYKVYELKVGEYLFFPFQQMYAFQRIDSIAAVFHQQGEELYTYTTAAELLSVLDTKESWGTLYEELSNSSANLALSLAYWKHRRQTAKSIVASGTPEYAREQKDAALFFEQLAVLGHNLHPCAKTRVGMEPDEVLKYAPEFQQVMALRFLAVHKAAAEQTFLAGKDVFALLPELQQTMEQELGAKGLAVADYVPFPVHPWQLTHIVPVIYEQELKENTMVILDGYKLDAHALSSFRTVQAGGLAIKVAVRAQMTSTIRSISPQTANNAAIFSTLIREVMEREPQLADTFVPVYEWGGGSFRSNETEKKRNISFVIREQVKTEEDELAITGTALYSESLVGKQPILLELIAKYQRKLELSTLQQAASQWFSEYASLALEGFLTLMVKYGIGLEGHLQNSIPVFRDGQLVRVLFRDWGGARMYEPRLHAARLFPSFYPQSVILTTSLEEMHNKVFYTVVQNHLGELVYMLSKHVGLVEKDCWTEVRRICEQLFDKLAEGHHQAVEEDRHAFFAPLVDYKALLTMRLREGKKSYSYVKVDNPLVC